MVNPWFNGSSYLTVKNAYNNNLPSHINVSSSNYKNSSNMAAWIGPAISAVGSIASSLLGGNSAKTQYKYQTQLNAQQQQYARENAATEYERQMQLTQLNPLLQKNGMKAAGINPSFANGSAVAAASSVNGIAAPSAGSAPNVPNVSDLFSTGANAVSTVLGSAGVLADNNVKASQAQNIQKDTEMKQVELSTLYQRRMAELNNMISNTRNTQLRNKLQEMLNETYRLYGQSTAASESEIAASNSIKAHADAAVAGAMNDATYNSILAGIEESKSRKGVNDSTKENLDYTRNNVLPAQVANYRAQTALAGSQAQFVDEQKRGVRLDNLVKENPTVQDARILQEVLKAAPSNVSQAIFNNPWYHRYMKAIRQGRKPTYEELWNMQRLMQQYTNIDAGWLSGSFDNTMLPGSSSRQNPNSAQ